MDEEPTGGPDDAADAVTRRAEQRAEDEIIDLPWDDDLPVALGEEVGAEAAGSALLTDDDSTEATAAATALADEADVRALAGTSDATGASPADAADAAPETAEAAEAAEAHGADGDGEVDPADAGDDMGELYEDDHVAGRRNALPRRVESWRSRSATGAIATAIAMGLQQVFEPERRRPAAVAEAPSDPYDDDDPITVDYVPDDAEGTTVHVKPWLLQKGEPG